MLYNYYVVVNDPAHKDEVHQELLSSVGDHPIPARPVGCIDQMSDSEYSGIFQLTEEEAELLATDLRILDVHRIPEEIGVFPRKAASRAGTFDKTAIPNASYKNWALSRCINFIDNFGAASSTSTPYTYTLDGTGVDIIIIDTGVEPGHPEFAVNADGSGGTRVIDHDWTQYTDVNGISYVSAITGGFMGDCDGHGSNCASIAAGNTNGWASGARIYSFRAITSGATTERSIYDGRVLGLIPSDIGVYRAIKAFHNAKPIDPTTGYKRPTVVSGSYLYIDEYSSISSVVWRGTTYTTSTTYGLYGTMGGVQGNTDQNGSTGNYIHGARYSAVEAEIQSCINAGVIVVAGAGNNTHKIDVPGGIDYNNYWLKTGSSTPHYYHRGGTPGAAPGVICVGAIGTTQPEHKINFSCTGPRIDIFAPGHYIMGAYANAPYVYAAVADPRKTGYYLNKISGTSQATPQVTGLIACILQARPWLNAADILKFLQAVSIKDVLNETFYANAQGFTYTQLSSLQGANNYLLYQPFNSPDRLKISG